MPQDVTMKQPRNHISSATIELLMKDFGRRENAEDRFLVDKGRAYAEIIISESPARSTRLAAAELQIYVAKICGAGLPIRVEPSADVPVQIYVGESTHSASLLIVSNTAFIVSLPVRRGSR